MLSTKPIQYLTDVIHIPHACYADLLKFLAQHPRRITKESEGGRLCLGLHWLKISWMNSDDEELAHAAGELLCAEAGILRITDKKQKESIESRDFDDVGKFCKKWKSL